MTSTTVGEERDKKSDPSQELREAIDSMFASLDADRERRKRNSERLSSALRFVDDIGKTALYHIPLLGPQLKEFQQDTGKAPTNPAAQTIGNVAGTLGEFAMGGKAVHAGIAALARVPQLAQLLAKAPAALQTQRAAEVARGLATGAATAGIQKASRPDEVGLRELGTNMAFLGGGALASDLTRAAIAARAPGMNRVLEAGLSGAAAGAGGTAAALPFFEKPLTEFPKEALINAAALAIFQAGMTYMTPYRPTAEFMRAGRKGGEAVQRAAEGTQAGRSQQVAAARQDFNSAIDEMYHVARQARPGMPMKMTPEARAQFEAIFNRASAVPPPVNVTPPRPTPLPPSQAAQDVPVAQSVQPSQLAIIPPGPPQPVAPTSTPPPAPIVPVAQAGGRVTPAVEPPAIAPGAHARTQADVGLTPEAIPQETVPEASEPPEQRPYDHNDIPLDVATRAFEYTSHVPEQRGQQFRDQYAAHMTNVYHEQLAPLTETPEQQSILDERFAKYREGYVRRTLAYLNAHANTASSMITGPANFPVERNRKRIATADRLLADRDEWSRKTIASIRKAIEGARTPEQASGHAVATLTKEIERNVGTIKKIDAGEEHYNRSAFVNSIAGYIKRAADRGDIEVARDALNFVREQQKDMTKPVFTDRHGIWTYLDKVAERVGERIVAVEAEPVDGLGTPPAASVAVSTEQPISPIATSRGSVDVSEIKARIETIKVKLTGLKRPNSAIAERRLKELEGSGVDIGDALDALEEYREMDPSDFEDREEYAEERVEAWTAFLDAVDTITIDSEEPETTVVSAPTLQTATLAALPSFAPKAEGSTATVSTERGAALDVQYALAEASDLVASHDTDLRANPAFPQVLQPRDRGRAATELQLTGIISKLNPSRLGDNPMASEGAPIVGPDGIVESGNARVIALQRMYNGDHPNSKKYKAWMMGNAEKFGLNPQTVQSMTAPVLVRIRRADVDREQFVRDANEGAVASMSAVEQAMSDARSMTAGLLDQFVPSESGQIFASDNRDFVSSFFDRIISPTERGRYMQANGVLSLEGQNRIRNAIFARAYGNPEALVRLAEDPDANLRNVTGALLNVAPRFVDLAERSKEGFYYDFNLAPELIEAANKISQLRDERTSVEAFLDQTVMFGAEMGDLPKGILAMFDRNVRSRKRMTEVLNTYVEMVKSLGMPAQTGLFGEDIALPTKDELFEAAVQEVESGGRIAGGVQLEILSGQAGNGSPDTRDIPEIQGGAFAATAKSSSSAIRGLPATAGEPEARGRTVHERPPLSSQRPIVTRKQAIDHIEKEFLMPVREGRLRTPGAKGEFNLHSHVTRIRRAEDFRAITHEFGHFLSETVPLKPTLYPELQPLGAALYPDVDPDLQHEEGAAEFFHLYFSAPEAAKAAAPTFYEDFEGKLKQNGSFGAKIRQAQELLTTLHGQTGTAAVKAGIVYEDAKTVPFLKPSQKGYTAWVDDVHPLFRLMQYALGEENVKSEWDAPLRINPYVLLRISRGRFAKATGFITKAQMSPEFKEIGPSLENILKPIRSRFEDFDAYLVARRAIELHGRNIDPGVELVEARRTVVEQEDDAFHKAAEQLYDYQSVLIDWLVDAGMLDKANADAFREMNKYYVPFYRYFGEETASGGFSGSRLKTGNLPKPVKAIEGSPRSVMSPLQSILRNTFALIDVAERNRVARAVLTLARENPGVGWLVEEVAPPMEPTQIALERLHKDLMDAGIPDEVLDGADLEKVVTLFRPVSFARFKETKENILTVWDKGKPVFLQVHPDIYRAMQFTDQPATNWLLRLLSFPTRLLRAGATLNPEFAMRNPARDVTSALMHSKFKFTPIVGPARAMFHLLKGEAVGGDKLYNLWASSGGAQSTLVSLNRDYLQKDLRKLMRQKTKSEKAIDIIRSPLTVLEAISSVLEESTRLSIMRAGIRGQQDDTPDPDTVRWAAYASREGTVDFQRAGRYGRQVNQIKAFFNAAIQGTDQMARLFKRNPVGYLVKAFLYITLPSVALYLLNKDDPRYQELPRWRRDLYFVFLGKDKMIFVPKGFELGVIFGTLPERILEYIESQDPGAFKEFADTVFNSIAPGDPRNPLDWLPDAMTPAVEVWANRNAFTGRPIIPRSEQDLAPEAQYGPHTTDTAKRIAWMFGVSPRDVEHLVTGYGAGLGRQVLRTIDMLSGGKSINPIFRPFGGDLFVSAASLDEFYEELAALETAQRTGNELAKRAGNRTPRLSFQEEQRLRYLRGIRDDLASYRRMNRSILEDSKLSVEEKRRVSGAITLRMVNLARSALGKPTIREEESVPLPTSRTSATTIPKITIPAAPKITLPKF